MTDWKALCEELADSIELLLEMRPADAKPLSITEERYARARAALAAEADGPAVPEGREPASVVGQPSDEELAQAAKAAIHEYKYPTELVYFLDSDSSEYEPFLLALRAAIAADRSRFGRQPAPPAAGEVGELVSDHPAFAAWLAREMPPGTIIGDPYWWAPRIARRAADLLEQRHPTPVPVAERLPGAGDVDGRDPECVQRWSECEDGAYDPRCCRFPKSCSCGPR
jgi:hypothetical protein